MKYYVLPFMVIVSIILILLSGNFSSSLTKIKLDRKIKSKIFNEYNNKYLFVFFGYVGCRDICTPRLQELSPIYEELKSKHHIDIDTIFINITKLQDKEQAELFAKYFHKEFDGIYLNNDKIQKVKNEFDIYSSPSLTSKGDFDHTAFLFLLKKQKNNYYLKRIYTYSPFDKDVIVKDILEGI